jgi:hypothetical protein
MDRELSIYEASEPMEVELADLAAILQMNESPLAFEPVRTERPLPVSRTKHRRCACGKCRTCVDNARWESVYQRKFADPYYYSLRHPKQGSSLNDF